MQENNENISEYLCDLVRKDKTNQNNSNLDSLNAKVDVF